VYSWLLHHCSILGFLCLIGFWLCDFRRGYITPITLLNYYGKKTAFLSPNRRFPFQPLDASKLSLYGKVSTVVPV